MTKKTLVLLTYITYIYTAVISALLIHPNNVNVDISNINGLVVLVCFSSYVVYIAVIEGIAIYKIKSRRMILHFLVILISFLLYFNTRIGYIYLLTAQLFFILILFLVPFFAKYENRVDENKRVLAYRYMYSQLTVVYISMFSIIKFSYIILYMWIILVIYLIIQYSFSNIRYFIKTFMFLLILVATGWLSSKVSIQNLDTVFSFDLIFVLINIIVLYISMSNHKKLYQNEIKQFDLEKKG